MGRIIALLLTIGFQQFANAIELGEPSFAGSGCRAESTALALSEDRQSLVLNFDEYLSHSSSQGPTLDRKNCAIAIPVEVPDGYQVALLKLELSGFAAISEEGKGDVRVETFFAGQTGQINNYPLQAGKIDSFNLQEDVTADEIKWSACGQNTILRINTSVTTTSRTEDSRALILIDRASSSNLTARRCQ